MPFRKPETPTTAIGAIYQKFWQGFNEETNRNDDFCMEFTPHPYASIRPNQNYAIGKPYNIVAIVNFKKHEIRIGAYFHDLALYKFCYETQRSLIEGRINRGLKWTLHQTKASAYLYDSVDFDFDENHGWDACYNKIIDDMLLIKKAFE
jgi:hypothetical protein